MAGLRVFVSSTCYDLSNIRSQLRTLIQFFGHEPLMSDYSDLLYDPRLHTHTSCIDEVSSADIVILIVGSRFGGKAIPEALNYIHWEDIKRESNSIESLKTKENMSVTQLEILKAVEVGIPVFTFVESNVWHDHSLYEKNKDKDIIKDITFPSIEKPETAKFIFEFINFLRHRVKGNSVFTFSRFQDIEDIIRKQWSALFQKLLQEQRNKTIESKQITNLTDQFENLKTAILSSMGNDQREIARNVVKFRKLLDFIKIIYNNKKEVVLKKIDWKNFLKEIGIHEIKYEEDNYTINNKSFLFFLKRQTYLIKEDRTFYELKMNKEEVEKIANEWDQFKDLKKEYKDIIIDTLSDISPNKGIIKYIPETIETYFEKKHKEEVEMENSLRSTRIVME